MDVLARRTRLAFQNVQAAHESLPRIVEIMAKELNWSKAETKNQLDAANQYLESMGYKARSEVRDVPISLSYNEAQAYLNTFKNFDRDGDGHIR